MAGVVLLLILSPFMLAAVQPAVRASAVQLTAKYIMAFLACDTSSEVCSDPSNHVTYLAQSDDGVNWSPVPGFRPYPGSVPDAIRRGETVYLYNPGTLVRFHLDTGVEDQPTPLRLQFGNGTSAIFVDPSLFLDSNGTLHLFYLPGIIGQDPAQCPVGQSVCTKHIMSATEVPGSDGGSFMVDPGTRVDYTVHQCCFSDPAVFQGPGGYYLYVGRLQSVLAFHSPTLTGGYSPVQGLGGAVLVQDAGAIPSGYYDSPSRMFWTFISPATILRASTPGIGSPIGNSSFTPVLSGCTFPGLGCSYMVGSPAVHLNTPGPAPASTTTTATGVTVASTPSITLNSSSSTTTALVPESFVVSALAFLSVLLAAVLVIWARRRRKGQAAG